MKTIHYFLIVLLALSGLTGAQAQSFPDYSEHSIWNDSYPIYDAVTYKGKYYALQNYGKDAGMRLVEFDVYPQNSTMEGKRYWTVGKYSEKERDSEVIEYKGALYIFGSAESSTRESIAHKFVIDKDGNGTHTNIPVPSFLKNPDDYYPNISATVYKNALCLFYINWRDQKILMAYTTDDPANENAKWEIRETISQPIYSSAMTGQDTWDVCTWFGESKEKKSEKLVLGLIAGPNMWAYTFEGKLEDSQNNNWTSTAHLDAVPTHGAFSLKLLQGAIVGVGSNIRNDAPDKNPVQFIYSIQHKIVTGGIDQRQIQTNEYFPSVNKMGDPRDNRYSMATNLPYGHFGAAIVSSPYGKKNSVNDSVLGYGNQQRHQQFIVLLRGACDKHFNQDSHFAIIKSNMAMTTDFSVPTKDLLEDTELRKFCTLTAVIEGPPPAVIDNENMYTKVLPGVNDFISSLVMGTETTSYASENNTTTISVDAGLGPDLDFFTLQALGGYEMNKDVGTATTITKGYGKIYSNTDTQMASSGFYVYTVPNMRRYDFTYYDPQGNEPIKGRPVLITFTQTGLVHVNKEFKLNDPNINDVLRIETPWELEEWNKRTCFLGMPTIFNFEANALVGDFAYMEEQVEHSNGEDQTVSLGGNIKTPGFQLKGEYSFKVRKETRSTLKKDIKVNVNALSSKFYKYFERSKLIKNYGLVCYFLNDPNNAITKDYYTDLMHRGAMINGEKPYIMAWGVTSIDFGDMLKDAIATDNETITPEGNRVYNDGDALIVESTPGSNVQIYSISGKLEANQLSPDGTLRVPLNRGVYIIRIVSDSGAKVYKAMKQ